jgi:hypothetical protein
LVELVASTFLGTPGTWPVFDYLDAEFEGEGLDAVEVLDGLPRDPSGSYAAVSCPHLAGNRPSPDATVSLTVLGMYHSDQVHSTWPSFVPDFLALIRALAAFRKAFPRTPTTPRDVAISGEEVERLIASAAPGIASVPMAALYGLLEREPVTMGAGGSTGGGTWRRGIPRTILPFADVATMDDYLRRTEDLLRPFTPRQPPAVASPLSLVAAVDYLDTTWRLYEGGRHLFALDGAERLAKLAFPVETQDDFASRLSGLGSVLRSVRSPAPQGRPQHGRNRPLAPLELRLIALRPAASDRIRRAIATLHAVLDIRDASQHPAASGRAAAGFRKLGLPYPPIAWSSAWNGVSARTVEALDALREELAAEEVPEPPE